MARSPARIPDALTPEGEAAFYRGLSPEERARLLAAACRAGAALLRARADAERVAMLVDPLPESSLRALARLRASAAGRRSRPATAARSSGSG